MTAAEVLCPVCVRAFGRRALELRVVMNGCDGRPAGCCQDYDTKPNESELRRNSRKIASLARVHTLQIALDRMKRQVQASGTQIGRLQHRTEAKTNISSCLRASLDG